jgi:hypothetical protein
LIIQKDSSALSPNSFEFELPWQGPSSRDEFFCITVQRNVDRDKKNMEKISKKISDHADLFAEDSKMVRDAQFYGIA